MKKLLIAICLMLLLATPVMALDMGMQTCVGLGYRSADGSMAQWAEAKLVTETSEKTFVFVKAGGAVETPDAGDYGIGAEFGFLVTNRLMMRTSVAYQRTNIGTDNASDIESPLVSFGADYFFTDVLRDDNEIIGASLSVTYNSKTKETGLFGGITFWFGKDNL